MSAAETDYDARCRSCRQGAGQEEPVHGVVYRDDIWLVRHSPPPYGLVGWMVIQPHRHVASPGRFSEAEARAFGPFLRRCERTLQEVTGAVTMYTASMGESVAHVHVHLVPRYAAMPLGLTGWSAFDVHRRAAAGEIQVDPTEVDRVVADYRSALADNGGGA